MHVHVLDNGITRKGACIGAKGYTDLKIRKSISEEINAWWTSFVTGLYQAKYLRRILLVLHLFGWDRPLALRRFLVCWKSLLAIGVYSMVWQRRIDNGKTAVYFQALRIGTDTVKLGCPQYTWFCRRSLSCFARLVELPLSKLRSCKTALLPNTHGYVSSKRMMPHVATSISSITHLGSLSAISSRWSSFRAGSIPFWANNVLRWPAFSLPVLEKRVTDLDSWLTINIWKRARIRLRSVAAL